MTSDEIIKAIATREAALAKNAADLSAGLNDLQKEFLALAEKIRADAEAADKKLRVEYQAKDSALREKHLGIEKQLVADLDKAIRNTAPPAVAKPENKASK
jgi:hypothetical protein